jgi:protein-tyrosine kinase
VGRIDEALRRASGADTADTGETAIVPAPVPPGGDPFESPWSFDEGAARDAAPASGPHVLREPPTELTPVTEAGRPPRLALFNGFDSEMAGRIVATPGASPTLTEQYRRLAATLHHAQIVNNTKILMVTSASPSDGKTLTSTNLALTLSESYRREVLLIDADLRRPSLHEVFRVPNVAGLNDGLKAPTDCKLSVLKITETLTLLPAGAPDPDPMSGLSSPRMGEILRQAASRFDWVIVDTAPVGLLTDANLLTVNVDGVLLVVRAHQTPHAAVMRSVEAIGRNRILGVVLNAMTPTGDHHYYGYSRPDADGLPARVDSPGAR